MIFLKASPEKGACSWFYGHILWGITLNHPNWAKQAVDRLEQLWVENRQDADIATFFSNGLVTYLYKDRNANCAKTIDRLKDLYNKFATNDSIAASYARGLCFLTSMNDDELGKNAVDELEVLYSSHPACQEIVTCLVNGIHNMVRNKGVSEQIVAIDRLGAIQQDNPGNIDVVLRLLNRLGNLLRIQNPKDSDGIMAQINRIYSGYSEIEQVQKTYAATLVTASSIQSSESEIRKILLNLQVILNDHPGDNEIILFYALIMYNLAFIQEAPKRNDSIEKLRCLFAEYPSVSNGFRDYLRELVNIYRYADPAFQSLI